MSGPVHEDVPALGELREQLLRAAHREMPAPVPRRRRVRRGGLVVALAVGLTAAGATGAALLDIGQPIKDVPGKGARYVPAPGSTARAVLTAQDPVTHERWGVATYDAAGGQQCIVAGQLRGQTLGLVSNGAFRPYTPQTSGPCSDLRHGKPTSDARYFPAPADRTVIYGLIRARTVQFRVRGTWFTAHVGHGGAYMLLFQGRVAGADVDLRVP